MTLFDPHDPRAFERRQAALRRLVARLVVVPEDAEDVVQDTWLAALSRRAGAIHNPDGWLHRVARYQAARRRRRDAQRRERELRAARSVQFSESETEAPSERLVDAVAALREPYRSVILLRFEEELPPEVIAERLSRPVTTVKSQLNRGLNQIRARLPEPEERRPRRLSRLVWPGFLRSREHGLERLAASWVVISAAGCALFVLLVREESRDDAPGVVPSTAVAAASRAEPRAPHPTLVPPERVSLTAEETPAPPVDVPTTLDVAGTVFGRHDQPVPNARIWVASRGDSEEADQTAMTGLDGRFHIEDVDPDAWVSAEADGYVRAGWANLSAAGASDESVELSLHVVETKCRIKGLVRDDSGRPIAGARICVHDDRRDPWLHQGGWRMPGSEPGPTSLADGTFELDTHSHFSQWQLVTAAGYAPALESVLSDARETVPVEVVLARGETLRGEVFLASGAPASDATVEFRPDAPFPVASARARADGSYELPHLALGSGTLVVQARNAEGLVSHRSRLEIEPAMRPVRAVLDGEATIEGTAADVRGRPLSGWTVIATRDEERGTTLDRLTSSPRESVRARTDACGRFALGGLAGFPQRLHLFAPGEEGVARATRLVRGPTGSWPIALMAADELARLTGNLQLAPDEIGPFEVVARSKELLHDRFARVEPGSGAFAFADLLPGPYELFLWDPAGPPTRLGTLSLGPGGRQLGRLTVLGKGSLELSIRAPGGRAVAPQVVLLRSLEGCGTLQALPGMERRAPGEIATSPIRAGGYELVVKATGYADFIASVDVERPRQPLRVDVRPGAFIVVWVWTPEGLEPGQEVGIRVENLQGDTIVRRSAFLPCTNPDRATLNLPLGEYRVVATLASGEEASAVVEVTERSDDQPHKVRIHFPPRVAERVDRRR